MHGARGETRTRTLLPTVDFESTASANSATRAHDKCGSSVPQPEEFTLDIVQPAFRQARSFAPSRYRDTRGRSHSPRPSDCRTGHGEYHRKQAKAPLGTYRSQPYAMGRRFQNGEHGACHRPRDAPRSQTNSPPKANPLHRYRNVPNRAVPHGRAQRRVRSPIARESPRCGKA